MSTILTSLFGKRAGFDKNGYWTTDQGIAIPALKVGTSDSEVTVNNLSVTSPSLVDDTVTSATSGSTGTAISNSGITTVVSTRNQGFTLSAPTRAGLRKMIVQTSAATANTVTLASGTYDGTHTIATFTGTGSNIHLIAASTSLFQITNLSSLGTGCVLS